MEQASNPTEQTLPDWVRLPQEQKTPNYKAQILFWGIATGLLLSGLVCIFVYLKGILTMPYTDIALKIAVGLAAVISFVKMLQAKYLKRQAEKRQKEGREKEALLRQRLREKEKATVDFSKLKTTVPTTEEAPVSTPSTTSTESVPEPSPVINSVEVKEPVEEKVLETPIEEQKEIVLEEVTAGAVPEVHKNGTEQKNGSSVHTTAQARLMEEKDQSLVVTMTSPESESRDEGNRRGRTSTDTFPHTEAAAFNNENESTAENESSYSRTGSGFGGYTPPRKRSLFSTRPFWFGLILVLLVVAAGIYFYSNRSHSTVKQSHPVQVKDTVQNESTATLIENERMKAELTELHKQFDRVRADLAIARGRYDSLRTTYQLQQQSADVETKKSKEQFQEAIRNAAQKYYADSLRFQQFRDSIANVIASEKKADSLKKVQEKKLAPNKVSQPSRYVLVDYLFAAIAVLFLLLSFFMSRYGVFFRYIAIAFLICEVLWLLFRFSNVQTPPVQTHTVRDSIRYDNPVLVQENKRLKADNAELAEKYKTLNADLAAANAKVDSLLATPAQQKALTHQDSLNIHLVFKNQETKNKKSEDTQKKNKGSGHLRGKPKPIVFYNDENNDHRSSFQKRKSGKD